MNYLDATQSTAGLAGKLRVRVALDVLEHCAALGTPSIGGRARVSIADVTIDDEGWATVPKSGTAQHLMTLLWEILAGKPSPTDETPWSDPASDLADDVMGALASLSMRPPSSPKDLYKRFSAVVGSTAAAHAEVAAALVALQSGTERSADAILTAVKATPGGLGAATVPAPAIKVRELVGLTKESRAAPVPEPTTKESAAPPETASTPPGGEPRRTAPPRPGGKSGPPKTAFAKVLLAKGAGPKPRASEAPAASVLADPRRDHSDVPPVGAPAVAAPPVVADATAASPAVAAPAVASAVVAESPSSAVSERASVAPVESRPSTAPQKLITPMATGVVFAASQPPPAHDAPRIERRYSQRPSAAPRSLRPPPPPPSGSESAFADADLPAEPPRRSWLLSGIIIGLVVLVGLWGWGRGRAPAVEDPPPVASAPAPADDGARAPAKNETPRGPRAAANTESDQAADPQAQNRARNGAPPREAQENALSPSLPPGGQPVGLGSPANAPPSSMGSLAGASNPGSNVAPSGLNGAGSNGAGSKAGTPPVAMSNPGAASAEVTARPSAPPAPSAQAPAPAPSVAPPAPAPTVVSPTEL